MLVAFHKLLIASALLFCLGYGLYEMYRYFLPGEAERTIGALWTGVVMLLGAAGLAGYLAWLVRHPAPTRPAAG